MQTCLVGGAVRGSLLGLPVQDGAGDKGFAIHAAPGVTLAKNGLQPSTQSPEEFARIVKRDVERWSVIAKATGFTAED